MSLPVNSAVRASIDRALRRCRKRSLAAKYFPICARFAANSWALGCTLVFTRPCMVEGQLRPRGEGEASEQYGDSCEGRVHGLQAPSTAHVLSVRGGRDGPRSAGKERGSFQRQQQVCQVNECWDTNQQPPYTALLPSLIISPSTSTFALLLSLLTPTTACMPLISTAFTYYLHNRPLPSHLLETLTPFASLNNATA